MLSSLYHSFANNILLYKYDKKIWKILFYPMVLPLDIVYYILSPLEYHNSRKQACGDTYVLANFGIVRNNFQELQDYIQRTKTGMSKKCPMLIVPLKQQYTVFPFRNPTLNFDKDKHFLFREQSFHVTNSVTNQNKLQNDITKFIKSCLDKKKSTLTLSNNDVLRRILYENIYQIDTSNINMENITKPLPYTLGLLLGTFVPEKLLTSSAAGETITQLKNLIQYKFDLNDENAYSLILALENASTAVVLLIYQTLKQIHVNGLHKIIKEQLNKDLVQRCVIESMRFLKYHPGITLLETLEEDKEYNINGEFIRIEKSSSIIRSIPACLNDTKVFTDDFYPYRHNIELVRDTCFNGLLNESEGFYVRSCMGQKHVLEIITSIIFHLFVNYKWDSMNDKDFETPLQKLKLYNITSIS